MSLTEGSRPRGSRRSHRSGPAGLLELPEEDWTVESGSAGSVHLRSSIRAPEASAGGQSEVPCPAVAWLRIQLSRAVWGVLGRWGSLTCSEDLPGLWATPG